MTTYKQTDENAVTWTRQDGPDTITTGIIVKGRIRQETVNDKTVDYDEWQRMLEQEASGGITIDWWTQKEEQALAEEKAREQFKANRQAQLDNAVITTQSGKQFDADEVSISRMLGRIFREQDNPDDTLIGWSLYTDATGVKTQIILAELKEAYILAVDNMDALWGV